MVNTFCPEATRHGIVNCPSRIPAGLGKPVRLDDLEGGVHKAFFFPLKCIWPLVASTE